MFSNVIVLDICVCQTFRTLTSVAVSRLHCARYVNLRKVCIHISFAR